MCAGVSLGKQESPICLCVYFGLTILPETNIATEYQWLEDGFPFRMACMQVLR